MVATVADYQSQILRSRCQSYLSCFTVEFSPDGNHLVAATSLGELCIWKLENLLVKIFHFFLDRYKSCSSPTKKFQDGSFWQSSEFSQRCPSTVKPKSFRGQQKIFDCSDSLPTPKPDVKFQAHNGAVYSVAFSKDGSLLFTYLPSSCKTSVTSDRNSFGIVFFAISNIIRPANTRFTTNFRLSLTRPMTRT